MSSFVINNYETSQSNKRIEMRASENASLEKYSWRRKVAL